MRRALRTRSDRGWSTRCGLKPHLVLQPRSDRVRRARRIGLAHESLHGFHVAALRLHAEQLAVVVEELVLHHERLPVRTARDGHGAILKSRLEVTMTCFQDLIAPR